MVCAAASDGKCEKLDLDGTDPDDPEGAIHPTSEGPGPRVLPAFVQVPKGPTQGWIGSDLVMHRGPLRGTGWLLALGWQGSGCGGRAESRYSRPSPLQDLHVDFATTRKGELESVLPLFFWVFLCWL